MNSSGTVNRHTPRKVCFGAVSFRIDKISPTANGLTDEKSERSKVEEGKNVLVFDFTENKTYNKRKILVVFLGALIMIMALAGRLVYLMIFDAEYYQNCSSVYVIYVLSVYH